MTTLKTIILKAGQVLNVCGYLFPIQKNCKITITGEDISGYYTTEQVASSGVMVQSYTVKCSAIKLAPLNKWGYMTSTSTIDGKPFLVIHTSTDIGGDYIQVAEGLTDGGLMKNPKTIAFLHNGFGDGNYRLKFQEGILHR